MKKDKCMLDVAYEIVTENQSPIAFMDLVNRVAEKLEMTDEEKLARLGAFYTDLSFDGRFVALTDNTWDLRLRHTYEKVHIKVDEVYSDEGDDDIDEEEFEGEEEEKAEYEGEDVTSKKNDLEGTGFKEEDF